MLYSNLSSLSLLWWYKQIIPGFLILHKYSAPIYHRNFEIISYFNLRNWTWYEYCKFSAPPLPLREGPNSYTARKSGQVPEVTLRPRLLLSFRGSTTLKHLIGNSCSLASLILLGSENATLHFFKNSLVNSKFSPSFSGVSISSTIVRRSPLKKLQINYNLCYQT